MRTSRRSATRFVAGLATAALAVVTVAACAGTGGSSAPSDTPARKVSTTVSKDPVTLRLAYVDDPPTKALVAGFRKKYPNVKIELQQTPFADYIKSIKLAMSSGNPPDIAQYNPGAMNSLVPAGLVLPLDPWSEAYDWKKAFPAASLDVLRSDKAAKEFGTGKLYAVPGALSVLGVFYNKKVLADSGVRGIPRTLGAFEDAMAKAKAAGYRPLSVGGLDGNAFHVWNALLDVTGKTQDYRDWVYGKPGASIEKPDDVKATETFTSWVRKGFIAPSANATSGSDAQGDFAANKSAFIITGNWAAEALDKAMGDNVGFFLLPSAKGPVPVASGASVAYTISSKSEHADVAAAFLNYLASPEAARIAVDGGFMPVNTTAKLDVSGLRAQIAPAFAGVVRHDGIVPFPDFASPGMIDKLTPGSQALIAGRTTEKAFLRSLQGSWDEHHGS